MLKYFTLDNFNFKGKVVGLRIDINSPIIDGKITLNQRIVEHSKTILELSQKGAKVVILAHQGRKGSPDFISLKEHSKLISKHINKKVDFIDEIYSKKVEDKIKSLNDSYILLLENLRFIDDEKDVNKKNNLILKLEPLFDFYVFDAFSVAHREQTSVIGFKRIINIAGRVMEKELKGLSKIENTPNPHMYILGGAKPDDLVGLIKVGLENKNVDLVLLTGVIGEIALHISGYNIGKKLDFLKEHNYLNSLGEIKSLLIKYKSKIIFPKDVAIQFNGKRKEILVENLNSNENKELLSKYLIQDIGLETIKYYKLFFKTINSIYFKGPAGNFEEKNFQIGTKEIFKLITSSNAFTFMGGGHSVTAAENFNYLNKFSYVSLAGGALVKFLSNKKLAGVESLRESFEKHEMEVEDFIVIGSNVIDTQISVNSYYNQIHLGDKIKLNDDFKTTVGGGGVNVSVCLSRLGAKVGFLSKFSYEKLDLIKSELEKNKISIIDTKISKRPVAKSIIIDTKDGDRVIYTYKGQNAYLESKDIDLSKLKSNYYYLNSLTGKSFDTLIHITKNIKKINKNSIICYNPSIYLLKSHLLNMKQLLKNVNILILNYSEAMELVNKEDISINDCFKNIIKLGPEIIVITDGANGAYLYDSKNNKEYFQKSITDKIIDTTGAGDCFAGTFFYFYSKGKSIEKSLYFAARNASSVIEYKGAVMGLKYYDDLVE